jgi:hypothetical protein
MKNSKQIKKHATDNRETFYRFLPEISPVLFKNFDVKQIKVTVTDRNGNDVEFCYKKGVVMTDVEVLCPRCNRQLSEFE